MAELRTLADDPTLAEVRADFARSPFLAMPIAGTLAWAAVGALGTVLDLWGASMALFFCTGFIFPLGLLVARFTGEDLLGKTRQNPFDRLFVLTILMANLSWAIAIPFWWAEPTSLPLSVGILAGAMWVPFSWMIQHWVGIFHGIVRTLGILAAWFLFPDHRFVAVPAVIVAVYLVSIVVLARRARPGEVPAAAAA